MEDENGRHILRVYVGSLSLEYEALSVEASKHTAAEEIVSCIVQKLGFTNGKNYELAEVIGNSIGEECKERRLSPFESPVALKLLWPKSYDSANSNPSRPNTKRDKTSTPVTSTTISPLNSFTRTGGDEYRFCLREKLSDSLWTESFGMDPQIIRDYFYRFLYQPSDKEYPDLCQLPDLNEETLLENLRSRFTGGHIYTYVGSILISLNPFKFHPIYNPKYVKLYQNRRREELPPHIFAIADSAYHTMLKHKKNQCIVISGESGSGKTESTNFLLHHLTALSQKGTHGSGVEQTILSAGPVLEAFGNSKTAHNNNSSRFGKFIQVSYRENGMVHGAIVQKYLLEKSRICCQGLNERNYHVFYYLLAGANEYERTTLALLSPSDYHYLNQSGCYILEGVDESYEFSRLKQSMEMVGFGNDKQKKLFSVLSAVLLLGNVEFHPKKSSYHHDESVLIKNPDLVRQISNLLRVGEDTLTAALTSKRARVSGEMLVINYRMPEAIAARDAMAKCLYGALFDWIVLQVNHALLSKKDPTGVDTTGKSIGVLDIFGFEDFGNCNSFEQYCINYANEHLQNYFNQHVFKYEQEEYKKEGIRWRNIGYMDNTPCLLLIEGKPNGLICILDDQCNFPGATNETLLQKFNSVHKEHEFYDVPQKREPAFIIRHYAGRVKYQISEFREKNMDLMRHDIVSVLKNSSLAFVRELVGIDPVAVFRWAILRAFFRALFAFQEAGHRYRLARAKSMNRAFSSPGRRRSSNNEHLLKKNRSFRSQPLITRGMKNLASVKTLASHSVSMGISNKQYNPRKQPISVSQQFQQSLIALMITLNQANPFFIRCIKSNSLKCPNNFDDEIVQRQLRYTGMLETVRIRQAGYNVRLSFEEFINIYRILLPKGSQSLRQDVGDFLASLTLNRSNYQLGKTKIFLREVEKVKLDYFLHQQIMASIIAIQRWYRTALERRHFLHVREAITRIQSFVRMFLAQRLVSNIRIRNLAATYIQKVWRGYRVRKWFENLRSGCIQFQARVRGQLVRQKYEQILQQHRKLSKQKEKLEIEVKDEIDLLKSTNETLLSIYSIEEDLNELRTSSLDLGMENDVENDAPVIPPRKHLGQHLPPLLSDSMPALTLALTSTPFSFGSRQTHPTAHSQNTPGEIEIGLKGKKKSSLKSKKMKEEESRIGIDDDDIYGHRDENGHGSKNPFHRAKKHIKTFIGGSKQKTEKPEAMLLESEESDGEDGNTFGSNADKEEGMNRFSTDSSSRLKSEGIDLKYNRSLLHSLPTSSIPEHDDFDPNDNYSFYQKYTNKTSDNSYTGMSERQNRREERRRIVGEPRPSYGSGVGGEDCNLSRRGSEDYFSDLRRDSNQSVGSPSHSSQDSLFDSVRMSGIPLTQSLSYGYVPSGRNLGQSIVMGAAAHRKARIREEGNQPKASSSPDILSSRDIRRTRSVSDSRPEGLKKEYSDSNTPFGSTELSSEEILSSTSSVAKKFQNNQNGHFLDKMTKYHRGETCGICKKNLHVLFAPGCRCEKCRMIFHTKCLPNGIHARPCPLRNYLDGSESPPSLKSHSGSTSSSRKKYRKPSKSSTDKSGKFNLTGTSEFTDRTDQIISGVRELQLMQEFISKKIFQVRQKEGEKISAVDRVFHQALCEFKESLVSTFSVASKQSIGMPLNIKYKDLIGNFANIMETVSKDEGSGGSDFPTTMGVNAFRGFLNEFMNANRVDEKPKTIKLRKDRGKDKGSKRQKMEEAISHLGHSFVTMVINIPTACEICSSFIMWPIERGLVCQKCKLACHKKCHLKILTECIESHGRTGSSGSDSGVFGSSLRSLVNQDILIPLLVDQLVTAIEFYGLRQEGLYRKSGVSSRVRELKQEIEDGKEIDWNSYPVHVLTSVLKSFFRELPEPLLTYELYEEFLRASDLSQSEDRIHTIFAILKKLPKPNYDLMERLVFHLVRVALYEEKNRMNANSLAIVFAPCILRTNKTRQVQDSLNDISRQTLCIETIISEQLKKVKETLSSIESVDSARHSFSVRLNSIRSSKMKSPPERKKVPSSSTGSEGSHEKSTNESTTPESMSTEEEEEYLTRHLKHLQDEKAMLTSVLPSLSRTPSDDDLLSTDPEGDSPGGSVDDLNLHRIEGRTPSPRQSRAQSLQYSKTESLVVDPFKGNRLRLSPTLRLPATSPLLQNIIKTKGPVRKPPSRFARNLAVVDFGEGENEDEGIHRLDEDEDGSSKGGIDSNQGTNDPILV